MSNFFSHFQVSSKALYIAHKYTVIWVVVYNDINTTLREEHFAKSGNHKKRVLQNFFLNLMIHEIKKDFFKF